jgi:hypothetical protein
VGSENSVVLKATGVWYYAPGDEAAFFEWLRKIPAVESIGGEGDTLDIVVSRPVDPDSLRELLALFRRYDIELAQLGQLDNPEVSRWFHDPRKYWYEAIFGSVPERG